MLYWDLQLIENLETIVYPNDPIPRERMQVDTLVPELSLSLEEMADRWETMKDFQMWY